MGFDRFAEERRRFRSWTTKNRDRLLATGIPIVAWSKYEYWDYLMFYGFLPYEFDPARFSVEQMTAEQVVALRELVEDEEWFGEKKLLDWLRSYSPARR